MTPDKARTSVIRTFCARRLLPPRRQRGAVFGPTGSVACSQTASDGVPKGFVYQHPHLRRAPRTVGLVIRAAQRQLAQVAPSATRQGGPWATPAAHEAL